MSNEYELEKLYQIIVEKAAANTNPRYRLYTEKEHEVKNAILKEIQKYNKEFNEYDYEEKIFCKITDAIKEYSLDAFAKGIEFERNLHGQTTKHANNNYDI